MEATASEISQLKACDMLGSRTARCTLIELDWAAGVVRGELEPDAAASVELFCSRARFSGVKPLPASLPALAENDEDDEDDEDDEGCGDEAGVRPTCQPVWCVPRLCPRTSLRAVPRAQRRGRRGHLQAGRVTARHGPAAGPARSA